MHDDYKNSLAQREIMMTKIDNPIVSVIITGTNTEARLRDCLDSILAQTLQNIEIICVLDDNIHDTSSLLCDYATKDFRIRIIGCHENYEPSSARNIGIRAARGTYVFFVDNGDMLDLMALELCVNEMESQELEYLTFNIFVFGEDLDSAKEAGRINQCYNSRRLESRVYLGQEMLKQYIIQDNTIISPWPCILKRSSFLENELWFHNGIKYEYEPWTFITLMCLSRCGYVDRILYKHQIPREVLFSTNPTFAQVNSLFEGYLDIHNSVVDNPSIERNEEIAELTVSYISKIIQTLTQIYQECDEEEKQKKDCLSHEKLFLFNQIVARPLLLGEEIDEKRKLAQELSEWCGVLQKHIDSLEEQLAHTKEEKNELNKSISVLKSSHSFRVGNCLIFLPSKLKSIFLQRKRKSNKDFQRSDDEKDKEGYRPQNSSAQRNRIIISASTVKENRIIYNYEIVGEWSSCFRKESRFEVIYPINMEEIPESVRIIPFLSQVLPVSWICNAEIIMPVCDQDFFECFIDVKAGYCKMYPMLSFNGSIQIEQLERNAIPDREGKPLVCFSGGVDAVNTAIAHLEEKPLLVSLHGADVPFAEQEGWRSVERIISDTAKSLGLQQLTIHSSFRDFLLEEELTKRVSASNEGWWYGFQHGIGILGHMAPMVKKTGSKKVYIASSYTAKDNCTCASHPSIDNNVRFSGAEVIHDSFDLNRQEKTQKLVHFCMDNGVRFSLHCCWEKIGGENCCHCEKCWRTMLGFYVEGADPRAFGFNHFDISCFSDDIENNKHFLHEHLIPNYLPIQNRLRQKMKRETLPPEMLWFYDVDLSLLRDGWVRLHKGKLFSPIWLLGTPEHSNMGDQCITEEEKKYLQYLFPDSHIFEVTEDDLLRQNFSQLRDIPPSMTVFLQGGGNLGTLWPYTENIREQVIERLPNNHIIIMPESIWFSDEQEGSEALARAESIYCGDNILLCCRDKVSLTWANEHFNCKSILIPDMVMWEGKADRKKCERFGSLTLLRNDRERRTDELEKKEIEVILAKNFKSVEVSDTVLSSVKVTERNRKAQIDKLIKFISSVECVVTDRLHGMILCAITETPCVVLKNGYHKVEACYEWFKDLDYIQLINNTNQLQEAIDLVCSVKERYYPEEKMKNHFWALSEHIMEHIQKSADNENMVSLSTS